MKKTVLLISFIVAILFATEKPNGGYKTWNDFKAGKVTYGIDKFDIEMRNRMEDDCVSIKCHQDDGKTRKWRSGTHGPLKVIKRGSEYFLYFPNVKLHYYKNYSWFTIVTHSTTVGGGVTGTNGMTVGAGIPYSTTTHYIVDMNTGKSQKLKKKTLRNLLKETPELAQEFENESFKKKKLLTYLQRYLSATN